MEHINSARRCRLDLIQQQNQQMCGTQTRNVVWKPEVAVVRCRTYTHNALCLGVSTSPGCPNRILSGDLNVLQNPCPADPSMMINIGRRKNGVRSSKVRLSPADTDGDESPPVDARPIRQPTDAPGPKYEPFKKKR